MSSQTAPAPPGLIDTSDPSVPVLHLSGEDFPLVERLAPGVMLELAGSIHSNDFWWQAAAFQRFLFAVVAEGEEKQLEELLFRKRDPVDFADIEEAVERLMEHYAKRPTRTPSRSRGGRGATPATSTGDSPSPPAGQVKQVSFKHRTVETVDPQASTPDAS